MFFSGLSLTGRLQVCEWVSGGMQPEYFGSVAVFIRTVAAIIYACFACLPVSLYTGSLLVCSCTK